jgi:hypothetical protein
MLTLMWLLLALIASIVFGWITVAIVAQGAGPPIDLLKLGFSQLSATLNKLTKRIQLNRRSPAVILRLRGGYRRNNGPLFPFILIRKRPLSL